MAVALVFVLLLAGGAFWLVTRGDDATKIANDTTSITTVPINGTGVLHRSGGHRSADRPKTTQQPVTVAGGEPGLYGGTRNISSCDRRQLIDFLMANPDKGRAWSGVQGIEYDQIPAFVMKLTPLLLRSDTLVMNHGYADGQATVFPSVLQAGTAVLADAGGCRSFAASAATPHRTARTGAASDIHRAHLAGWNPQSITVIIKNTTLINIFIVVDPATGEEFSRPAGTAGGKTPRLGPEAPRRGRPDAEHRHPGRRCHGVL